LSRRPRGIPTPWTIKGITIIMGMIHGHTMTMATITTMAIIMARKVV